MGEVKIAVIGGGYWGKNIIRNLFNLKVLDTICDSKEITLFNLKSMYPEIIMTNKADEVFSRKDINAVVVSTPAETHYTLVKDALLSNKDVLVEKPLCLSLGNAAELIDIAKRNNRILMVGHLMWYHPAVLKLSELVNNGELGRIWYIYSSRLNLGKIRREENILWSFAPHDVSVILGLIGEMPCKVISSGGYFLHNRIADTSMSILDFPSGIKAHIFVSWLHPFKKQKMVIVGEKQMAVFDDTVENKLILYPHKIDWVNNQPTPKKNEGMHIELRNSEPLKNECECFINCIENRTIPKTDGNEGLRVLTVLDMCQKSMENNRKEFLNDLSL